MGSALDSMIMFNQRVSTRKLLDYQQVLYQSIEGSQSNYSRIVETFIQALNVSVADGLNLALVV